MATTYTGRLVTPGNFQVPSPLDLAVQRGRMPRFNGATRHWWSVLHHVAVMYGLAQAWEPGLEPGQNTRKDLWLASLLLHDGEESMTYDTQTTWKTAQQRELEHKLEAKIYEAYLGRGALQEHVGDIKRLDRQALFAEMLVVGPPGVVQHSGISSIMDQPNNLEKDVVRMVLDKFPGAGSSTEEDSPLVQWFLGEVNANKAFARRAIIDW
jgi:hypothetical protein